MLESILSSFGIIGWLFISIIIGAINHNRGNSFIVGFLLSLILSPIVGSIVILLTRKDIEKLEWREIYYDRAKRCSECAEIVNIKAKVCKYCDNKF